MKVMGYIGKEVLSSFTPTVKDSFDGDNSTPVYFIKRHNLSLEHKCFDDNIPTDLVLVKRILYLVRRSHLLKHHQLELEMFMLFIETL